ncbi:uncharacterized protein BX664DRAFT_341530 [Halteromyces radiatus]|uniref:uncharacterized protein n=1 Tax=Halteromyces radiatus TaxID=101107 RepID=UPI0022204488|nr:uncharacterized protein BX664DRAFT_341530 [Halteromyces radiatus]KAI8079817.1 hypothetical protein BX664DRAFT_341530 [Halteromyces radiatus]
MVPVVIVIVVKYKIVYIYYIWTCGFYSDFPFWRFRFFACFPNFVVTSARSSFIMVPIYSCLDLAFVVSLGWFF